MGSTILSAKQKGYSKMAFHKFFFIYSLINIIVGEPILNAKQKSLSLFSIVNFPNDECITQIGSKTATGATKGTCVASSECTSDGGVADGNCADGFGVCCVHKTQTDGATITKNRTWVQNPGFSNTYTTTSSKTFSYSVKPMNKKICQIRLDFQKFVTQISTKGACTDSFVAKGPTNSNGLANLCGTLTGQHVYLEQGRSSTSATLTFTLATSTTAVSWNIKVSQISCDSDMRAPHDCAQWITGPSGFVKSYNWNGGDQIQGNQFTFCIRREDGYCNIVYKPASDTVPAGTTTAGTKASDGPLTVSSIDTFQTDDDAQTILGNTNSAFDANLGGYIMISNSAAKASTVTGTKFGDT